MPDRVTIIPQQPVLFRKADLIGSVRVCPAPVTIFDQSFANCTISDQRVYRPFYVKGDVITFMFNGQIRDVVDTGDISYTATLATSEDAEPCGSTTLPTQSPTAILPGETGHNNYYFSFDSSALDLCCDYKIIIRSTTPSTIAQVDACSQGFSLVEDASCSLYFEWLNYQNFAYNMPWFGADHPLTARLAALEWKPRFKTNADSYINSKYQQQILYAESKKIFEVFVDDMPEYAHDFLRIAILSDLLKIDGNRYEAVSEDYTPEWQENSRFAQVKLSMSLYDDKQIKTNC